MVRLYLIAQGIDIRRIKNFSYLLRVTMNTMMNLPQGSQRLDMMAVPLCQLSEVLHHCRDRKYLPGDNL